MRGNISLMLAVGPWVLGGLVVFAPQAGLAQEPERVRTTDPCDGCRIVVDTVAHLAARDGPGILADETLLEMDAQGRLFALDYVTASGQVLVFDEEGSHQATIGRAGDGPGEFRMPWGFVRDGQTMAVFDRRRGIIAWIDLNEGIRRTASFTHPVRQAVRLSDELWIANSFIGHPDVAGHIYHRIRAPDYALAGSFGQEGVVDLERDPTWVRHLTRESDSSFWSVPKNSLRVELWMSTGRRTRVLKYDPSWFDPDGWIDVSMDQPYTVRPFPEVSSIQRDPCELLWVHTWVPAADWEPIANTGGWVEAETHRQYDTRVTVIAPNPPRLVVEQVLPGKLRGMTEARAFYALSEEPPGHPVYTVGRFALEGATSNGGVECSG
jgi:hypothetical protein